MTGKAHVSPYWKLMCDSCDVHLNLRLEHLRNIPRVVGRLFGASSLEAFVTPHRLNAWSNARGRWEGALVSGRGYGEMDIKDVGKVPIGAPENPSRRIPSGDSADESSDESRGEDSRGAQ